MSTFEEGFFADGNEKSETHLLIDYSDQCSYDIDGESGDVSGSDVTLRF